MSVYRAGRKSLAALIAVICLLLVRPPMTVLSKASQGGACGPSMQGADRLRADLGLDGTLANRANSLAASALRSGQPPPPNQIQSLTEDSLDGLNDAGDQLDQAAGELSKQLDAMNLPRQQRLWSKGVTDMRTARTNLRSALRQDPIARGQKIGSLSPTGVGPRVMYEAASSYQNSVENLGSIADQSGFVELGQKNWIEQGKPDMTPPPNPGPDPWQEWLRRMWAQQTRIRNNVNGLNAARALQAGQFQQAQQNAADMQKAVQNAQNLANQLSQMAAACDQAAKNQQSSQSNQPAQPKGGQGGSGAGTVAGGAGGAAKGLLVVGGLGVAAAGGYALYKSTSECTEPTNGQDVNRCLNGSCSACASWLENFIPYCDCVEQKHPEEVAGLASVCRDAANLARQAARECLVPKPITPVPAPAVVR